MEKDNNPIENDILLDYPFDLYQRTRDIREIIDIIARETHKDSLKILDVGGYRIEADDRDNLLLREFLPQHNIFAMDMVQASIPHYVRGDGTQLPFKPGSFDIVVTSDVYEHVPPQKRLLFLDNLLEASTGFVILGAPFYSPKNELAEKIVFEYVRKALHSEQLQLKEHIENRLPNALELENILQEKNLPFISFQSGNLSSWMTMMILKHYLMSLPDTNKLETMIDRFYNMNFYESDHSGEGYRQVFIIARDQSYLPLLEKVKAFFAQMAETHKHQRLETVDLSHIRMLLDFEALRTRALIDEKDGLIRHQALQIEALNNMRSTRVYRVMQFFNQLFLSPFMISGRWCLAKSRQAWLVLTNKRPHPFLSLSEKAYRRWVKKNEPKPEIYPTLKLQANEFKYSPLISIVVPAYNTPKEYLEKAILSVLDQVYENWELCITNDGSPDKNVREVLDQYAKKDGRIRIKHLPKNRGIARATNESLSMATGEFIAFMDSDDTLHPLALYEIVSFLNQQPNADVIYTDEDKLTLDDKRRRPEFKSSWNPDLFLTYNYINHLTVCRKKIVDEVEGFRTKYNWSQDYDLYLRITEKTDRIFHLPKILYHWREMPNSSASKVDVRPKALAASIELLNETIQRRGIPGTVTQGLRPGTFRIKT